MGLIGAGVLAVDPERKIVGYIMIWCGIALFLVCVWFWFKSFFHKDLNFIQRQKVEWQKIRKGDPTSAEIKSWFNFTRDGILTQFSADMTEDFERAYDVYIQDGNTAPMDMFFQRMESMSKILERMVAKTESKS